jgi:ATP-binding cassette subfamily F protein 3
MVKQAVGSMSGGEKARLVLCMIVWQRPNLLLLDEPTNHLDLATREALAMALNEFEGTVMLVSHDRALLRSVCDEFWMVSRGGVEPFDGDLDDYQRYLLDEAKRQRELAKEEAKEEAKLHAKAATAQSAKASTPAAAPPVAAKSAPASDAAKKRKKELTQVETRMEGLNAEAAALEERLSSNPPPAEIAEAGKRLKAVNAELGSLEEQWLELSAELEA